MLCISGFALRAEKAEMQATIDAWNHWYIAECAMLNGNSQRPFMQPLDVLQAHVHAASRTLTDLAALPGIVSELQPAMEDVLAVRPSLDAFRNELKE